MCLLFHVKLWPLWPLVTSRDLSWPLTWSCSAVFSMFFSTSVCRSFPTVVSVQLRVRTTGWEAKTPTERPTETWDHWVWFTKQLQPMASLECREIVFSSTSWPSRQTPEKYILSSHVSFKFKKIMIRTLSSLPQPTLSMVYTGFLIYRSKSKTLILFQKI